MSSDQWVAVLSAAISFIGLVFVALQMRASTRERKLEVLYQVYDVNRQLLSLGFSDPELFHMLGDAKNADPVKERRYLQLWFNQLSMIHSFLKHGEFEPEFQASLERDIRDFMSLQNMQRHWRTFSQYYPLSFQVLVDDILSQQQALTPALGAEHLPGDSLKGLP